MNHCPNLNAPAIQTGKVSASELDTHIAEMDQAYVGACTANACKSGRAPCPCPEACRVPAEELDDSAVGIVFWAVLGIALVACGFLVAGGANLLLNWIRTLL
jgi:hypothetical protein